MAEDFEEIIGRMFEEMDEGFNLLEIGLLEQNYREVSPGVTRSYEKMKEEIYKLYFGFKYGGK
jgi:hypothetical protein